jgi:hypothetical protein
MKEPRGTDRSLYWWLRLFFLAFLALLILRLIWMEIVLIIAFKTWLGVLDGSPSNTISSFAIHMRNPSMILSWMIGLMR